MDQISLPMRIALVASLAFAALWFVALRPKPVDVNVDGPLPASPAAARKATADTSTPSAKAEKVAKADTAARTDTATKTDTADKVAKTEPKADAKQTTTPAAAKLTGSKAVMADVEAGRTVVLLFYHPSAASADDLAVRRAVKDVDRHGGAVRVHTASLGKLGQYEAITKTAKVTSTPTVLVIDRKAQVRSLQGLTVTREIDALVDRALKSAK